MHIYFKIDIILIANCHNAYRVNKCRVKLTIFEHKTNVFYIKKVEILYY
jgi:hypothetical protein